MLTPELRFEKTFKNKSTRGIFCNQKLYQGLLAVIKKKTFSMTCPATHMSLNTQSLCMAKNCVWGWFESNKENVAISYKFLIPGKTSRMPPFENLLRMPPTHNKNYYCL